MVKKHYLWIPTLFAILIFGVTMFFLLHRSTREFSVSEVLTITIPEFPPGESIPEEFTCKGLNVSPSVIISNVPPATQSMALIMRDPDGSGGTQYHWLVWNIPSTTTELSQNTLPDDARVGTNSFKKQGYEGPCPQTGKHRYIFTLYALDNSFDLEAGSDFDALAAKLGKHTLGSDSYEGFVATP